MYISFRFHQFTALGHFVKGFDVFCKFADRFESPDIFHGPKRKELLHLIPGGPGGNCPHKFLSPPSAPYENVAIVAKKKKEKEKN